MRPIAITSALTAAAAAIGARGTNPESDWYLALDKPRWQPPGIAFPLVWTPLYGLIAWGTGRAIEKAAPTDRTRLEVLTGANLATNSAWNWAFFNRQSPATGMAVILALDALNVTLLREASRHDKRAAAALTPYVAWTAFATALNASIWLRNR